MKYLHEQQRLQQQQQQQQAQQQEEMQQAQQHQQLQQQNSSLDSSGSCLQNVASGADEARDKDASPSRAAATDVEKDARSGAGQDREQPEMPPECTPTPRSAEHSATHPFPDACDALEALTTGAKEHVECGKEHSEESPQVEPGALENVAGGKEGVDGEGRGNGGGGDTSRPSSQSETGEMLAGDDDDGDWGFGGGVGGFGGVAVAHGSTASCGLQSGEPDQSCPYGSPLASRAMQQCVSPSLLITPGVYCVSFWGEVMCVSCSDCEQVLVCVYLCVCI